MSRWTKNQKEMQGYKRKLAYGQQKVSLVKAPWEKGEQHGKRKKSERVWKYLIENQAATAKEVSAATGVSYGYVSQLMRKIGTPKEVRMMCEAPMDQAPSYSRQDILDTAGNLIDGDRHEQYGDAEANFTMIASYWNTHLGL